MRLVRRLTIYLLIPIALVFALDTILTLRSDLSMLDADMHRDDTVLARDLAVAVEQAWRNLGERAARDLVSRFQATESGIEARIVSLDAAAGAADAPAVPERVAELPRDASPIQARAQRGDALWLFTYVGLDLPGSRPTALEVSEIVSHEREHLAARIPRKVFTAGVMLGEGFRRRRPRAAHPGRACRAAGWQAIVAAPGYRPEAFCRDATAAARFQR